MPFTVLCLSLIVGTDRLCEISGYMLITRSRCSSGHGSLTAHPTSIITHVIKCAYHVFRNRRQSPTKGIHDHYKEIPHEKLWCVGTREGLDEPVGKLKMVVDGLQPTQLDFYKYQSVCPVPIRLLRLSTQTEPHACFSVRPSPPFPGSSSNGESRLQWSATSVEYRRAYAYWLLVDPDGVDNYL